MLPFWVSIGALSLLQGAIVAMPRQDAVDAMRAKLQGGRLASRWWALLPPASVAVFVAVGVVAASASADVLTYVALIGVPIGAALALGWLAHGARWPLALLVLPLFALAWADRGALAGQAAAVTLSALSCVALGALLGAATPTRWLALGIVAMAIVDATLVGVELLQAPNAVLNAAHPAAGLPRLQAAIFGDAAMGYGDLFVAGLLGGLLAATGGRGRQYRVAALVAALSLCFDLLFFVLNELPATVPVAAALVVLLAAERSGGGWARRSEGRPDRRVTGSGVAG